MMMALTMGLEAYLLSFLVYQGQCRLLCNDYMYDPFWFHFVECCLLAVGNLLTVHVVIENQKHNLE